MRSPEKPPTLEQLHPLLGPSRMYQLLLAAETLPADTQYYHWDTLRFLTPPGELSLEEWWLSIKVGRSRLLKEIPLRDSEGRHFQFLVADPIPEQLHVIDLGAGGRIGIPEPVLNEESKDQYYIASLMEEAITSSQLEGAATTRAVAKEMLRSARLPRDRDERMILNNFLTMQQISQLKERPLTPELVLEIHHHVTTGTLDDPSAAGRFRRTDEDIVVTDLEGYVFHVPPPAAQLTDRLTAMCDFANGATPSYFIHPALRSIMLHFWLAYDHPFVDGNGRTARALFYWSMLHHGFWLCEYLSISHILRKAPAQYSRSFLYTETDDNDLTYFLVYQIEVLRRAIADLHTYVEAQSQRQNRMEEELRGTLLLNHRQRALISHALRHPQHRYTVKSHQLSHNIAYQTARTDLLNLAERGLLKALKIGKTWYFSPMPEMEANLAALR